MLRINLLKIIFIIARKLIEAEPGAGGVKRGNKTYFTLLILNLG